MYFYFKNIRYLHKAKPLTKFSVRKPAGSKNKNSGFTLMEILIAVAILSIGVVAVVNLFPVGIQSASRAATFTRVGLLVQSAVEFYRLEGYEYIGGLYDPLPTGAWKDVGGTEDVYIPAPADTNELERGGGMEGAEPFEDNPDYRWRIVISEDVEHESDVNGTLEDFHADAEIYKIILYIYWLDRGQEQWDVFEFHIANHD